MTGPSPGAVGCLSGVAGGGPLWGGGLNGVEVGVGRGVSLACPMGLCVGGVLDSAGNTEELPGVVVDVDLHAGPLALLALLVGVPDPSYRWGGGRLGSNEGVR